MGVLASHLLCLANGIGLVLLPVLSSLVVERVVGVGCREEDLDAEEDGADLQGWGPLGLQHVEADAPHRVDVGVVDGREEACLGRAHGVVVRQEELELEDTTLVWRVLGPCKLHVEVPVVVLVHNDLDTRG